jgi:hypothetical protein
LKESETAPAGRMQVRQDVRIAGKQPTIKQIEGCKVVATLISRPDVDHLNVNVYCGFNIHIYCALGSKFSDLYANYFAIIIGNILNRACAG